MLVCVLQMSAELRISVTDAGLGKMGGCSWIRGMWDMEACRCTMNAARPGTWAWVSEDIFRQGWKTGWKGLALWTKVTFYLHYKSKAKILIVINNLCKVYWYTVLLYCKIKVAILSQTWLWNRSQSLCKRLLNSGLLPTSSMANLEAHTICLEQKSLFIGFGGCFDHLCWLPFFILTTSRYNYCISYPAAPINLLQYS